MLSGISVICFFGSYLLALLLEISRLFFRSRIRGLAMVVCALAGLLANTLFLYYHGLSPEGYPITSQQELFFVSAWILAALYVYLTWYRPQTSFGLYLLPMVLGLIAAGQFLADPTPFSERAARGTWAYIHGLSFFVTVVIIAFGFVSGLMYLAKSRQLKQKLPPRGRLQLPSLEWLQRDNERTLFLGTLTLALGVLSGMMLNRIIYIESSDYVPWYDPAVLGSCLLLLWLVTTLLIALFYPPIREGHKVAYQTVVCFVFLMVILLGSLLMKTRHWQIETLGVQPDRTSKTTAYETDSPQTPGPDTTAPDPSARKTVSESTSESLEGDE